MALYPKYESYVKSAADTYGVDESLIWAVIKQESSGDPAATSSAGAKGLMQLMPYTAKQYGVTNAYDPEQNINAGANLLSDLLIRWNGDTESALAAYYAGSGNVSRYGKEKYSKYYNSVLSNMETLGSTTTGTQTGFFSPFITDGLQAGGLSWLGLLIVPFIQTCCFFLGILFLYFAINGIPDAADVAKAAVKIMT